MKESLGRQVRQRPFARPDRRRAGGNVGQCRNAVAVALALLAVAFSPARAAAQQLSAPPVGPRQVVIGALKAACAQNSREFSSYLLADSRRALAALPEEKQKVFLRRFSLTSMSGHARALFDTQGRMVVQCTTPAETVVFHLSKPRIDSNVAVIPVRISGGEDTSFGLVHQPKGWRLFSLGLLVINVPSLVRQWEEAEMRANEQAAVVDLISIEQAVKAYHDAFGAWPNTLAQLGPAPPNGVSPEHAQLLSARLASGTASGYRFRYRIATGPNGVIEGFELGAVPDQYGKTGRTSYFRDTTGKLHAADKQGAPATVEDPVFTVPPEPSSS